MRKIGNKKTIIQRIYKNEVWLLHNKSPRTKERRGGFSYKRCLGILPLPFLFNPFFLVAPYDKICSPLWNRQPYTSKVTRRSEKYGNRMHIYHLHHHFPFSPFFSHWFSTFCKIRWSFLYFLFSISLSFSFFQFTGNLVQRQRQRY